MLYLMVIIIMAAASLLHHLHHHGQQSFTSPSSFSPSHNTNHKIDHSPSSNINHIHSSYTNNNNNHYLRVATWNIRVPFPSDVQNNLSWNERRRSIATAIETHEPDLLAVQEDCYFMNEYLMNSYNTHTNNNNNTTTKILSNVYNRYGLFNRNGESYPTPSWQTMHSHPSWGKTENIIVYGITNIVLYY